jgi:hypothetical protein
MVLQPETLGFRMTVWPVDSGRGIIAAMPRKREKGKTMDATGAVLKAVRLELPEKVHYALRVEAAKHEMSMAMFARKLVEEGLATRRTRKGKAGEGE